MDVVIVIVLAHHPVVMADCTSLERAEMSCSGCSSRDLTKARKRQSVSWVQNGREVVVEVVVGRA